MSLYTHIPNQELYQKRLGKSPSKIKVLDPFARAGNLMFPALELGLDVTCSDYNPLAHLIERGILEFPVKQGFELSNEFEKIANQIIKETENEVGQFFKSGQLTYLWVWCITCPHCSQRIPLTNQMWIAKTSKKKIGIRYTPTNDKNFTTELIQNMTESEGKKFTQKQGKAQCISCGDSIDYKTMTGDIAKNKDREMIAIQIQKTKGRDYILATKEDKKQYDDAVKYFKTKQKEFKKENLIPNEEIIPSHRREHTLWHYGIKNWDEFFSKRQLLILICLLIKFKKYYTQNKNSKISIYLSFLLGKLVNGYPLGLVWDATTEKPGTALTLRRPTFVFNHAEINPFEKIRGSLQNCIKNIKKIYRICI